MLLTRAVEERGLSLYKQGRVTGSFYDGRGQEATAVGATFALAAADPVCPLIRDLGAHIVKGTSPAAILGHYLGRAQGVSHGREGNVHLGDSERGVVGMVSMLPGMMPVAVGMAWAFKLRGEQRCALAFFGDGATSVGDWHEAMNLAGLQRVPAIFVLEHNGYAYSTPSSRQFVVDPLERAAVYGMAGVAVDGNDVEAVFEVTREARERALEGGGPTLIAATTMRMHGHGAHDDASYVPAEELELWAGRDPIEGQAARLRELGVEVEAIAAAVRTEVDAASAEALAMAPPDPAGVLEGVFCEGEARVVGAGAAPWSGFAPA
ncbi:MAG TPA: thiamine pyrophosphate-dependent dehydrogenase E1 component subunit alpha [Solirubrobacteraceae bacterium]|jgi:pyruvate dehydrogenase E1 component alpha subunit